MKSIAMHPFARFAGALSLFATSLLSGCAYTTGYVAAEPIQVDALSDSAVVLDIKTAAPGGPYDCGLVAVGAVAQYYGRPLKPEAIERLRELSDLQEALTVRDMTEALTLAGMDVFALKGDLGTDMRGIPWHLKAGRPCIVLVKREAESPVGHFLVICGHDPIKRYVLISDAKYGIVAVTYDDFLRVWGYGSLALLVAAPKG